MAQISVWLICDVSNLCASSQQVEDWFNWNHRFETHSRFVISFGRWTCRCTKRALQESQYQSHNLECYLLYLQHSWASWLRFLQEGIWRQWDSSPSILMIFAVSRFAHEVKWVTKCVVYLAIGHTPFYSVLELWG